MTLEHIQNILDNATAFSAVIGAVVLGLTQVVKNHFSIPKGYIPWVAVGLGILVGLLTKADVDLTTRILGGAIAGFSATGMFEAVFKFKQRASAK